MRLRVLRRSLPLAGLALALFAASVVPLGADTAGAVEVAGLPPESLALTSRFAVRWGSVRPVPLSTQRAMVFTFTTSGPQAGAEVLARILRRDGTVVREVGTGAEVLGEEAVLRWDGRKEDGKRVRNGVYVVHLVVRDPLGGERVGGAHQVRVERPVQARTAYRVQGAGRRVALTFDDCNFGEVWRRILAILRERNRRATFFCLGAAVREFPDVARRTVAYGNDIGSHSFNHPDMRYLSLPEIHDQLDRSTLAWWSVAGVTPLPYYRPPYGDFDADVLRGIGDRGYGECVLWDVDPSDWRDPGPSVIRARVLRSVRPGSIVLLHAKLQTALALPAILRGLRKMGLTPVTLSELFAAGTPVRSGSLGSSY